MSCTRNRLFCIVICLLVLAAVGCLSYYIWYITYYKYNIADRLHTIKFSKSNYEVKVIWRREDWWCWAEIYMGGNRQHEVVLGRWFHSDEERNSVGLTSGSGPYMSISVHEDLADLATIKFCTVNLGNDGCTYFNLNNLDWYCDYQLDNNEIPLATTVMRYNVDNFSDFQCQFAHTTSDYLSTYVS